jgi:hypothetical protein
MELTPEEEARRVERLAQHAQTAAIMRDFCRHAGFKILEQMVKEHVADARNEWLKAETPEKCWELKLKAQPWNELFELIFKRIANGDAAALQLRSQHPDSARAD